MIENKYYEDYVAGEVVVSDHFVLTEQDVATYCKLVGDDHRMHRQHSNQPGWHAGLRLRPVPSDMELFTRGWLLH